MTASKVIIEEALTLTSELTERLGALLGQLSSSASQDPVLLAGVIDSDNTALLVARAKDQVVGMCTLVTSTIPTGVRCWIEDVVVDAEVRGQGIGAELITEAIARAKNAGARSVDLTSRPSRAAANRLYQRLGFERRETNVYRYSLES